MIPLTEFSDDELVRRARQGDDAAFVELMRRTRGACQRRANSILRDHAAAEDEVQNAYLSAWRHMADFEGHARFSTWISRIVVNQCLMRLRSLRQCQVVALDNPGPDPTWRPLQLAYRGASVEEQAGGRRLQASLRHHILRLPPLLRGVLVLWDINEISSADVARQLGISVPAVKSRLLRARLELRRRMLPRSTGETSSGLLI